MSTITLIEAVTRGEPGFDANCLEWQFAPVSARAGTRGPASRTMDGYSHSKLENR